MHQELANATFRIQCGDSTGSGFSFRNNRIVVTNCHVIRPAVGKIYVAPPIVAITEGGMAIPAKLLGISPEDKYDFAILELQTDLPAGRHVLQPCAKRPARGSKVIFAGFPHGLHDLLVHEAIVSGPSQNFGFYLDGSVNGGNSGGPIISAESGEIVGIVTARRFPGNQDLQAMSNEVMTLEKQVQLMRDGGGRIAIGGIDFGGLMQLMNGSLRVISEIIELNANSGIGIGYHIEYLNNAYDHAKLP